MISLFLVALLIVGIDNLFKYTAQAVGQGQAINTAVRNSRAAQTTMADDFKALVPNGPGATDAASIIIASQAVPAFATAADKAGDVDGDPMTIDLDGNGKEGEPAVNGEVISPATYNYRNHRLDTLSFFARNSFHRQTGNDGTYVDDMTSPEAWIWYGDLWLPDNSGTFTANTYPGQGTIATNPNNVYASQFVLGRVAMLLKSPITGGTYGAINDSSTPAQPQDFIRVNTTNGSVMTPLANDALSTTYYSASTTALDLYQFRYDLAGTSIKTIQNAVANALVGGNYNWWVPSAIASTSYSVAGSGLPATLPPLFRYQANPSPSKPLTALKMAGAAPYFMPGCSQFIVEYAGDFVTQDNNPADINNGAVGNTHPALGQITSYGPDGTLDYVMVQPIGGTTDRSTWSREIKWYGMPRNTSGRSMTAWYNGDVTPIRDFLYANYVNSTGVNDYTHLNDATFESGPQSPATTVNVIPPLAEAGNYTALSTDATPGMSAADAARGYVAAFGPNDPAPKLIRITITLTDPSGALPDGQTYQFVFAVPPQ